MLLILFSCRAIGHQPVFHALIEMDTIQACVRKINCNFQTKFGIDHKDIDINLYLKASVLNESQKTSNKISVTFFY